VPLAGRMQSISPSSSPIDGAADAFIIPRDTAVVRVDAAKASGWRGLRGLRRIPTASWFPFPPPFGWASTMVCDFQRIVDAARTSTPPHPYTLVRGVPRILWAVPQGARGARGVPLARNRLRLPARRQCISRSRRCAGYLGGASELESAGPATLSPQLAYTYARRRRVRSPTNAAGLWRS